MVDVQFVATARFLLCSTELAGIVVTLKNGYAGSFPASVRTVTTDEVCIDITRVLRCGSLNRQRTISEVGETFCLRFGSVP
jgi:hypothetical protein